MSAALKSATGSTSFGLRRTASLEEFLDKDKEEVSIELNQPPIYKRKTSEDSSRLSRKSGESYYTYIIAGTIFSLVWLIRFVNYLVNIILKNYFCFSPSSLCNSCSQQSSEKIPRLYQEMPIRGSFVEATFAFRKTTSIASQEIRTSS